MIGKVDLGDVSVGAASAASQAATPAASFEAHIRAAAETATDADKSTKVEGHQYAKVDSGTHDGMYVNQTTNARKDELFRLVSRDGREFHVYGTGKDAKVFELKSKTAATSDAGTVDATKTTSATTTPATTSSGTTAATTTAATTTAAKAAG